MKLSINNIKLKLLTLILLYSTYITAIANHNVESSAVVSPKIPSTVVFADQKVSLDDIDMYERYDRELTSLCYTHSSTMLIIKRANKIFPILAPILKANDIPIDFIYLACIESSLDPTAVSPARAAGLWQFMPATGREFGLEVNDDVDERYNIEKSTEAACKYFKQAYEKYGNWESVAASYNAGQGRISRELASQQVKSAFDLWLVPETSRYMFRLMAMKEIMRHPGKYGYRLKKHQLYQPVEYEIAAVDSVVTDWSTWAKEHGIDYLTLRLHNPWIRSKQLPNKSNKHYDVAIPIEKSRKRSTGNNKVFNEEWIVRE